MATRLRIVLVTCLLVFILMDANSVLAKKGGGKFAKLAARVKDLEGRVGGVEECKPCSSIYQLTERLNEMGEEIEELKNPPTTLPTTPATTPSPPPATTPPPPPADCIPIGVADVNKIADGKITSSSVYLQYHSYKGRLHGEKGWCPSTKSNLNDFIQVDMDTVRTICKVATQGKKNGSYVKSFKLSLSTDGVNWNPYKEGNVDKVFQANGDLETVVQNPLNIPAQARYVRFYPVAHSTFPCMRIEVFVQP